MCSLIGLRQMDTQTLEGLWKLLHVQESITVEDLKEMLDKMVPSSLLHNNCAFLKYQNMLCTFVSKTIMVFSFVSMPFRTS